MAEHEALDLAQRRAQRRGDPRATMIDLQRERAPCRAPHDEVDPRAVDDEAVRPLLRSRPSAQDQTLSSQLRPRALRSAVMHAMASATRALAPFMPSSSERR